MTQELKRMLFYRWSTAILALTILVVNFIVWILHPALFSSPLAPDQSWFETYILIGTWAVVHAVFNAIAHGLVEIPTYSEPNRTHDRTIAAQTHLAIFSLLTLVIIPIISVPIMLSLHVQISSMPSVMYYIHQSSLLGGIH